MLASLAAPSLARSGSGHGGGGSHSASTSGSTLHRCTTCMRDAEGHIVRSEAAKREFERLHPCPATPMTAGSCPGYVVDHVTPLACGGEDAPGNMQWQTVADGQAKDEWERRACGR